MLTPFGFETEDFLKETIYFRSVIAEVGSSMIMMSAFSERALRISRT